MFVMSTYGGLNIHSVHDVRDVHDYLHDCYIFAPYVVYVFDVCNVHDNRNVWSSLDN
jgi:hypothetical protein